MGLSLRPYQKDAVEKVWSSWHDDGVRTPAVVMATGGGKTHVIASLAERWNETKPPSTRRVLVLAHRTELIDQASARIRKTGFRGRVGIVKGQQNACAADIVVGSVQTLRGETRRDLVRDVGLVIVDECHHAVAKSYMNILEHYGALPKLDGPAVAVGFTATMFRADRKQLGDVWTHIPFSLGFSDLVGMGYLVPPVSYRIRVSDLDLGSVKMSHGDYQVDDLGRALGESLAPSAVIRAYEKHAKGRQALLFTPTVDLSMEMAALFADAGYRTGHVDGKTPKSERTKTIKRYKNGQIDILCNCSLFTEGTDLPSTECVIMMRPTKSQALFIQIVGRGARVDPDNPEKTDFVFLDVCGASQGQSLSASIELFGEPVDLKGDPNDPEELIEKDGTEEDQPKSERSDGTLDSTLIDLFAPSRPAWRQTDGGHWFLARSKRRILAIVPAVVPGCLDLVDMGAAVGDSTMLAENLPTLTEAMRLAEAQLGPHDTGRLKNGAKWRSQPPTSVALQSLRAHGITVSEAMTAGVVSDLLGRAVATRRVDPCVNRRMESIRRYV